LKQIEDVKILVVGDIMLDEYIVGDVNRISPEAPVPIVNVKDTYYKLGGCGNVISNLSNIGAKVTCVTSIGQDDAGNIVLKELMNLNVNTRFLISKPDITTTIKTRIISDERQIQMFRYDRENIKDVDTSILKLTNGYDVIVVSDYAKGMMTESLMDKLKNLGNNIIVDPKPVNAQLYNDVFLMTPNLKEYNEMKEGYFPFVEYVLKTIGKNGMELIEQKNSNQNGGIKIESKKADVYNVSGAGDTVVAILSLSLALGIDLYTSAKIANECAGYVVTQPGTSMVPKEFFKELL
jgi:rfaE bifunctional protein kinase chain/domain